MACNCGRNRGEMDDASVDYFFDLMNKIPRATGEYGLLDIEDPLINLLVEIIKEKAQYLNDAGLEYLIMRLRQKYVERVPDMGLSKNDFNDEFKQKLEDLPTNKELQDILSAINSAEWEVVTVLPSSGKPGTFYLVKLTTPPAADNQYAEYIWVNGKWELLGVMSVSGNGLVTSIKRGSTTYSPDTNGLVDLGSLANKATMNGSTYNASTAGTIALGAVCKSITMNGSTKSVGTTGTIALGGVCTTVKFNGTSYSVSSTGTVDIGSITIPDVPEIDYTGLVKSLTLNGSTITPSTAGVAALGALCKSITMNGSTKSVGTTGTIALGAVCTKITLNGTTYSVGTTGTIALGTIESGGSANEIYTGTTNPAASLGSDGDFYYKMK